LRKRQGIIQWHGATGLNHSVREVTYHYLVKHTPHDKAEKEPGVGGRPPSHKQWGTISRPDHRDVLGEGDRKRKGKKRKKIVV